MNRLLEFYNAIYQGIDWRNYPTYENMVSIGEEHFEGVGIFLKDFQEWEQAGFPDLNEYLTPINGWKRTKYVAPPEFVTLGKYTIKPEDLEDLLEKLERHEDYNNTMKNKYETITVSLDHLRRINWGYNYNPTLLDINEGYFEKYKFEIDFQTKTISLWGMIDFYGSISTHFIYSYDDWNLFEEIQNVI